MSTVPTPPGTTLSTPSPTEREATPEDMPAARRPLYLIVATSLNPPRGIGNKGNLPWPPLKADMKFFKDVTSTTTLEPSTSRLEGTIRNAVIMGRKTWESIPPRFRPLKDRLNVVVTRGPQDKVSRTAAMISSELNQQHSTVNLKFDESLHCHEITSPKHDPVIIASTIGDGLRALQVHGVSSDHRYRLEKVFVIGGAQIYQSLLEMNVVRTADRVKHDSEAEKELPGLGPVRILQTQVRRKDGAGIDCDTFFPRELPMPEDSYEIKRQSGRQEGGTENWRMASFDEIRQWVGPTVLVPSGPDNDDWKTDGKDSDMEIRIVGWERQ